MTYKPHPANTSEIILPDNLHEIVEFLARNTHENWAAERIRRGWRYGPHRNDARKESPCLVPFDELTDREKEHDIIIVTELLKTLISLGYSVRKKR